MVVHGLNINSGKPTMPKEERYKIRTAVKELESIVESATPKDEIQKIFNSVSGRVNLLKRLHPQEAQKYIARIVVVKEKLASIENESTEQ
jgi:hypothetical protein